MWITEVTIAEKVSDLLFIKNWRLSKSVKQKNNKLWTAKKVALMLRVCMVMLVYV